MHQLNCYFNGEYLPLEAAGFPVGDLGVQRGYGIFDFLRVTHGVPLFIDDHLQRFYASALKMRLEVGLPAERLKPAILELLRQNQLADSGVRILLTGGISPDGYQIIQPNLAVIQLPLAPPPDVLPAPYKLVTHSYQREMPEVKTTNYLQAVWLHPWMKEQGADDVLYQRNGIISECPRSNFFIVTKDGKIATPATNILNGITRKQLLRLAADQGIVIEERDVSVDELQSAREAFITSSTKRIIPVKQIDEVIFDTYSTSNQLFLLLLKHEQSLL